MEPHPQAPVTPLSIAGTKRRRITQACDFCHRRGVKCREAPSDPGGGQKSSCMTCIEYAQECTRMRRPKKRGTKPRGTITGEVGGGDGSPKSDDVWTASLDRPFETIALSKSNDNQAPTALRSRKVITALLDVYLDTIHPT